MTGADEVLNWVWSDISPGTRMRFITPSFVRRGTLVKVKGGSMRIQFDGLPKVTVLPNARQYFIDHKNGREDWGLAPIKGEAISHAPAIDDAATYWPTSISVALAANILGTDSKTIRRKLRAGTIKGTKIDGTWVIDPGSLKR